MVFVGLRVMRIEEDKPALGSWKNSAVIHFNPHYVKLVNERKMLLVLDDGSEYRLDDESLQVFLAAMYGEGVVRGDKLRDDDLGVL